MQGVLSFNERLRRVRDAYALEKQANMRMSAELVVMKDRVMQLEERLRKFGAGNGDGAEGACGETLNGATVTEGTGKPTALGGAATQDPSTPPNIITVNLSADTEVGQTSSNDAVQEGKGRDREHATVVAREPDVASVPMVEGAIENYEHVAAADDDDGNIASAAQSVQTPTEEPVEDVYSVAPTTDSVAVGDGASGVAEEPPFAGDGAHCVPDLGESTTSHTADDQSCPRSSNIVSRLKKVPRIRKPSRVWGSPYTNPTRGTKGGRKGVKSAAPGDTRSGHCSPSRVQSDVGNDEAVVSVVPIAEVPLAGEVEPPTVLDARLMVSFPVTDCLLLVAHRARVPYSDL